MRCTPTIHDLATPPSLSSRPDAGVSALAPAQRAGAQRLCALAQSRRAACLGECPLLGEQADMFWKCRHFRFGPGCVKTRMFKGQPARPGHCVAIVTNLEAASAAFVCDVKGSGESN